MPRPDDDRRSTLKVSGAQIVTWSLNLFVGIGLSVGAWYFNGMNTNVAELRKEVSGLKTQVALLQSTKGEVELLKAQVTAYIARHTDQVRDMAVLQEQFKALNRRVESLERGGN